MSPSFSVANINPGVVRFEFMMSIMSLVDRQRSGVDSRATFEQFYTHFSGPYLDMGRNACVRWFFENTESDYLVFMDSDIETAPESVFALVDLAASKSTPRGVYSGVYANDLGEFGVRPVAYRLTGNTAEPISWKDCEAERDANHLVEIDGAGAGFICIPRDCLKAVGDKFVSPTPWFAEIAVGESLESGGWFGEDLTFCLRAAHVGWPTFLATDLIAAHYKTHRIKPEEL